MFIILIGLIIVGVSDVIFPVSLRYQNSISTSMLKINDIKRVKIMHIFYKYKQSDLTSEDDGEEHKQILDGIPDEVLGDILVVAAQVQYSFLILWYN